MCDNTHVYQRVTYAHFTDALFHTFRFFVVEFTRCTIFRCPVFWLPLSVIENRSRLSRSSRQSTLESPHSRSHRPLSHKELDKQPKIRYVVTCIHSRKGTFIIMWPCTLTYHLDPSAAAMSLHKPPIGSISHRQSVIFVAAPVFRQAAISRFLSGLNRLVANQLSRRKQSDGQVTTLICQMTK